MSSVLLGGVIERYYSQIDAHDLDAILALFTEGATYERADSVYHGKAAIERFFRTERLIRGVHQIEQILSLGSRVIAIGRFEGTGAAGDARSVGFVDIWDFDSAGLVATRRTYLATGHAVVQR